MKPAQKSSSKSAHFFDDEDDEVEVPPSGPSKVTTVQPSQSDGTAVSIASPSGVGVGFPVPFPTLKAETKATLMLQRCPNACVVTNIGCGVKPPTLSALCEIGKGCLGMPAGKIPQAQMMQKKGAYYAYLPDIGNGAKNNGGEAQEEGGCMHIKCLKCSYLVVRLQGVQWEDADGSLDLYLTVRNFYPDWSRLAVASPVGLEEDDGSASTQRVLSADEHSAAYCCQCSWLTVRAPRAVIRTTMMDVMPFKDKGGNCFATHLPSSDAETRRPPLWVCSGHMLQLK